jgi:hypothetical protein
LDLIANRHTLFARRHHHLLGGFSPLRNRHRDFSIMLTIMRTNRRLILLVLVINVSTCIIKSSVGSRKLGLILLVRKMAVGSSFSFTCSLIIELLLLLLLTTFRYLSIFIKDPVWVIAADAHVVHTHRLLIRKYRLSAILPWFAARVHHSII